MADFRKEADPIRQRINHWAETETEGKIKDLLAPRMIDATTTLVLCNAVYFKGEWASRFDKAATVNSDFHISKDKIVQVPMMLQKSEFRCLAFDGMSAVELPYRGEDVSLLVFLPEEGRMRDFETQATAAKMGKWIDQLMHTPKGKTTIYLPRFKADGEFELSKTLGELGMPSVFRGGDFSGMDGSRDLAVSAIIHKAFIEVDEEGSEAAATTAVVMTRGMERPDSFRADRPFIFMIRENKTGLILFSGKITDPGKA